MSPHIASALFFVAVAMAPVLGACSAARPAARGTVTPPASRTLADSAAADSAAPVDTAAERAYAEALERLRGGDTTVDVGAMRLAFTRTAGYEPYGTLFDEHRKAMMDAMQRSDHQRAREEAAGLLATNYVDVTAHMISMISAYELGDSTRAAFHRAVARRLLDAVTADRSGTSPESPYIVINTSEEYALIHSRGLVPVSQALARCGEAPCDRMEVRDPRSGEMSVLYFDVSMSMGHFQRKLGPHPER